MCLYQKGSGLGKTGIQPEIEQGFNGPNIQYNTCNLLQKKKNHFP